MTVAPPDLAALSAELRKTSAPDARAHDAEFMLRDALREFAWYAKVCADLIEGHAKDAGSDALFKAVAAQRHCVIEMIRVTKELVALPGVAKEGWAE